MPRRHRASRPSPQRNVDLNMGFCVNCHSEKKAPERLPDLSLLTSTMDRRSFIKLTAVTGTSAALAELRQPGEPAHPLRAGRGHRPGVAEWKPSVCPLCAAGCGLTVRVMDADAEVVRDGQAGVVQMRRREEARRQPGASGQPAAGCARAARRRFRSPITPIGITQPLKRTGERGDGAVSRRSPGTRRSRELVAQLDALAAAGEPEGARVPHAAAPRAIARALVAQFLAALRRAGADRLRAVRRRRAAARQRAQLRPRAAADLRSARTRATSSASAPTSSAPGTRRWRRAPAYGQMRQGRPGIRGTFVQVESRMSQTGANADEWVPVTPGTEGVLALGLAHVIMRDKLRPADGGGPRRRAHRRLGGGPGRATRPSRSRRSPASPRARVERLARELAERRPRSPSSAAPPLAHTNGLFSALAVNALNALARQRRAAGRPVLHAAARRRSAAALPAPQRRRSTQLAAGILAGTSVAAGAAARRREPGVHGAAGVEGARGAREGPLHRQLRQLPRRDERAGRSDPARSLVPRVVGRGGARIGLDGGRGQRRAAGDDAAAPDARDAGRAARRRPPAARSRSICRGRRSRRC